MNISFRQLRAFTMAASLGSFVEAAQALHLSASAVSTIIRELEGELGFKLFERTTRRIRLSGAGQKFLIHAERILDELNMAGRAAVDLKNQKFGLVRIVTTQVITWMILPRVFAEFHRLNPDIRLIPMDERVDEVSESVESGAADLGIVHEVFVGEGLVPTTLFDSTTELICPKDHRFALRKSVDWSELENESLILIGKENTRRTLAELGPSASIYPAYQVQHVSTALGLVAAGLGLALTANYVKPLLKVNNLAMVHVQNPSIQRRVAIFYSKDRELSSAAKKFYDFILDYHGKSLP